jgi:hypothetical protein
MKLPPARPEDRRRAAEPPPWPDTQPAWRRSEAFAEDLAEAVATAATATAARSRPVSPRPGLALVLGLFGR